MVVSAIAIGGIYPAVVQRFQVQPERAGAEAEYIQRNIDATLDAYGLDDVEMTDVRRRGTAEAGRAARGRRHHGLDPPARPADRQPDVPAAAAEQAVLRLPRHAVGRPLRDRRREPRHRDRGARAEPRRASDAQQRNWVNDHTVYTHGFGVVAAYGNTTAARRRARRSSRAASRRSGAAWASTSRASTSARSRRTTRSSARPRAPSPWELDYPADDAPSGAGQHHVPDAGRLGRPVDRQPAGTSCCTR